MKFKNINPVERYFDKVAILVAAAAAAYFVYTSYFQEPNKVNGVKPGDVEAQIAIARTTYEDRGKNQKPIAVKTLSYVDDYKATLKQPLSPSLLAAVPAIAPSQLAINLGPGTIPTPPPAIALPVVPPLTEPVATSARALINVNVVGPGRVMQVIPTDITYDRGEALLQVSALAEQIRKLPRVELQHTAIYRIDVQRQEQRGGGPWSPWVDVPRLPIDPLPPFDASKIEDKDFSEQVAILRALVLQIIQPAFYPLVVAAAAPAPVAPLPPLPPRNPNLPGRLLPPAASPPTAPPQGGNDAANQAMQQAIQQAMNHGMAPIAPAPGGEATEMVPGGTSPGAPVASTAPAVGAPDAPTLLNLLATVETMQVWFWDTQVQPGYTYRYRARLEIINPLYHLPKQMNTIPPEGRNQVFLASDWTQFKPVTVEADEYFYLTTNNLGPGPESASFRVYIWRQGRWVAADDEASPGTTLGGIHPVLINGKPPAVQVDFGSLYTVIDIHPVTGAGANDVQVVLLNNSTGELVVHDMLSDEQDPQRKKLEDAINPPRQVSNNAGP